MTSKLSCSGFPFKSASLILSLLLTACASTPDRSLIPDSTDQITSLDGAFTQTHKQQKTQPGCSGTCPTLEIDALVFPGKASLNQHVEQTLLQMAANALDSAVPKSWRDLEQLYWQQAGNRDQLILSARTPYRNADITVIELGSYYYPSNAAHGMTKVQYLNWDNQHQRAIGLQEMLQTGQSKHFYALLRQAHQQWLEKHEAAQIDPNDYSRLWPFQPSDNVGISDQGLLVKYNAYEIAPYSSGQPVLVIPYEQLQGVLRPAYLPARR